MPALGRKRREKGGKKSNRPEPSKTPIMADRKKKGREGGGEKGKKGGMFEPLDLFACDSCLSEGEKRRGGGGRGEGGGEKLADAGSSFYPRRGEEKEKR